jgi:protein-L-isoaspartate(D-aspartate) O-methyltransferase
MRVISAAAMLAATATFAVPAHAQDWGCAKIADTILAPGAKPQQGTVDARKLNPPLNDKEAFIAYMAKERGDDKAQLARKWDLMQNYVRNGTIKGEAVLRAFLLTAREEFSRARQPAEAYKTSFLNIGCGVTISGPGMVAKMTSELQLKPGEKVLEIGTGSGYQSAVLANLTDQVYTIEIIPPLAKFTDKLQIELAKGRFQELAVIKRKAADGYYGWEEHGPFDKIIVTAGIDHVPPPLLKQLKPGGVMIIPIGDPGCQHVLKITKDAEGKTTRRDIYEDAARRPNCRTQTLFVAFTKYDKDGKTVSRFGSKAEEGEKKPQ